MRTIKEMTSILLINMEIIDKFLSSKQCQAEKSKIISNCQLGATS